MSGMNPTYHAGFASPQRGRIKYPGLWRGCDGCWCPELGPSGLILRDWSGRGGNHGTLTNMTASTAWTTLQGKHTITLDGSNDYIATGWNPTKLRGSGYACSMSCWVNSVGFTARQFVYGASGAPRWYVFIEATTRVVFVGIGSFGLSTSTVFPSSGLHQLAFTKVGTVLKVFIDGKVTSTNSYTGDNGVPNEAINLGAQTTGLTPINGNLGDVRFYNRCLADWEVALLALRRGIAYEIAPRRRSISIAAPTFKAAWLTSRQSQIIGGGMR